VPISRERLRQKRLKLGFELADRREAREAQKQAASVLAARQAAEARAIELNLLEGSEDELVEESSEEELSKDAAEADSSEEPSEDRFAFTSRVVAMHGCTGVASHVCIDTPIDHFGSFTARVWHKFYLFNLIVQTCVSHQLEHVFAT